MLDVNKCKTLIHKKMEYDSKYFPFPMIEEQYWNPLAIELSKNVDETISFWEMLNTDEFLYTLDVLDEIIQNTRSYKIIEAVKRISIEKQCYDSQINSRLSSARCWLD